MQFKIPILIIATFGLAEAFKLPADIGDGIYSLEIDESGRQQTTYLGPIDSTVPTKRSFAPGGHALLSTRDQAGCTARSLNSNDCNNAVQALENYCQEGEHYSTANMAFVSNTVFAYTCDYSGGQLCFKAEATLAYEEISAKCGSFESGWWLFGDNKNYGYDQTGVSFCANN